MAGLRQAMSTIGVLIFGLAFLMPALFTAKHRVTPILLGLGTVIAVVHALMGNFTPAFAMLVNWATWLFRLRAYGMTSFRKEQRG